ncbi:MAG TPA: LytTR family DNA-binding domain-containing protein [Thermoanaerobaculia bacterium]|nr:LytTR family DNA-binding domain-containing protein [Thermoanaerobaculia bacterium]
MSILRALIVEDEPLARARLRALLGGESGVAVIGEADNTRAAAELVGQLQPDLLFLDIQLPEETGIELLRTLEANARPVVIFTTAHPQYALEAFDVSAADYLVKPLDQERVARAVERARRYIAGVRAAVQPQRAAHRERFAVRTRGEIGFVKACEIDWISAEGNYARLHVGKVSYLLRESMQSMESALDPTTFIRVHRSAIVNLDRVLKLVPSADGTPCIVLVSGVSVPLGPTYRGRLEEVLGQKL